MASVDQMMEYVRKSETYCADKCDKMDKLLEMQKGAEDKIAAVSTEIAGIEAEVRSLKQEREKLIQEYRSVRSSEDEDAEEKGNAILEKVLAIDNEIKADKKQWVDKQMELRSLQDQLAQINAQVDDFIEFLKTLMKGLDDLQGMFQEERDKDLKAQGQFTFLERIRASSASASRAAGIAGGKAETCLEGIERCGAVKGRISPYISKRKPGGVARTPGGSGRDMDD